MAAAPNRFKRALAGGGTQIGLWSSLCSAIAAEVVADSGFDWVLIDTEHSPNELPDIVSQLQALSGGTATPIVRPAWNDAVLIKRVLDVGVQTVLLPFVQNAAEAAQAVAACRYPPRGIRGISTGSRASRYGRTPDYLATADGEICVLVQVETRQALAEIEAIAKVDGIDGIFIGPADLSASMGHLGNPTHPDVQAAIEAAGRRIRAAGKAAGILTGVEADAKRYLSWGFNFVAVGTDVALLRQSADKLRAAFRA